jgi:hypothetical protein
MSRVDVIDRVEEYRTHHSSKRRLYLRHESAQHHFMVGLVLAKIAHWGLVRDR